MKIKTFVLHVIFLVGLLSWVSDNENLWIQPGKGGILPAEVAFSNPHGTLGYVNVDGDINMEGHPFFEPLGTNGRACVSCHQPKDAMSVSTLSLQQRWNETQGRDPIFAAIDGSNNPKLPQQLESSHSLLLKRGLFRISLPWPVKTDNGKSIKPEFSIEVVSDPTGVNVDPELGLENGNISVFRRPRSVANMTYVMSPDPVFNIKTGTLAVTDPETGKVVGMNMMADSRHYTQKQQALDAYFGHLQGHNTLTDVQLKQILDFQNKLFMAQSHDKWGGKLVENGEPAGLGPHNMKSGKVHILANNNRDPIFHWFNNWKNKETMPQSLSAEQKVFRESVARGNDVFMFREFWIRDATHINSLGLGNPVRRSCATCHNGQMTAQDLAPGWVDLGTTTYPTWTENHLANQKSDLPIFKCTCNKNASPHPFLGRVIYTTDPGRALISGKCIDIGSIVMQQFRGLSARAPYFVNGSAKTLHELVDYYDRRFDIKYTEQEKTDLVNFLSVL